MSKQRLALLIASVAGMAASFLPWGSVLGISASGIDGGDGWITLVLFAMPLAFSLIGNKEEPLLSKYKLSCAAAGVVNIVIAVMNYSSLKEDITGLVQIGAGLYVIALAGIAVIVIAMTNLLTNKTP